MFVKILFNIKEPAYDSRWDSDYAIGLAALLLQNVADLDSLDYLFWVEIFQDLIKVFSTL